MMRVWGVTDIGLVRRENQDSFGIRDLTATGHTICVVCDGMGGAAGGTLASSVAVESFLAEVENVLQPNMTPEQLREVSSYAVSLANQQLRYIVEEQPEFEGMGTTLVSAITYDGGVVVCNVGDSRAYCIDRDGISQLTVDHSVVQMMVARGEVSPERAKTYPGKNLITRAIGTEQQVKCDIFHHKLQRGDCLLLCSDGLSNIVDEQEILFEVVYGEEKKHCCQRLLDIAKKRGAPDNVTSVLIQI